MNKTIEQFLKNKKINQEEYDIFFEDKSSWLSREYSPTDIWDASDTEVEPMSEKIKKQFIFYPKTIQKIIDLQKDEAEIDLSYIQFINFKISDYFSDKIIKGGISFQKATFSQEAVFKECTFKDKVTFKNSKFHSIVNFKNVIFKEMANFRGVSFDEWVSFNNITVYKTLDFTYSRTNDFIDFSDSKINNIDLEHSRFDSIGFLHIKGLDKNKNEIPLTKKHFANKESARLIKAHFEKQGNITEANKYFVIEQEKYIEELKDKANVTEADKMIKRVPLYLNKYISNFGTDWVRATAVLFVFAVLSNLIYGSFNDKLVFIFPLDSSNWVENIKDYLNTLVKMINPLNAFKAKDNIFKGYEAFGAIVRIISAAIIYQIIIAFRQFTRRA